MGVAFKGYQDISEILLAARADPHALNKSGQTALMMVALFGHLEITERLLGLGADPHLKDAAGNSAISVAEMQGNSASLEVLRSEPTA